MLTGVVARIGGGGDRLASERAGALALGYAALSSYALGTSILWNALHPLLLPLIVLSLVSEERKNGTLGLVTFVGLVVAMLVQPLAGALSDRARTRWGRRRPFILAGTLGTAALVLALDRADDVATLLLLYAALQAISNVALSAYQGLIPDLVPAARRGLAAGAKSFAEILGLIVAALALPPLVADGRAGPGLAATVGLLGLATAGTCLLVPETVDLGTPSPYPLPEGEGRRRGGVGGDGASGVRPPPGPLPEGEGTLMRAGQRPQGERGRRLIATQHRRRRDWTDTAPAASPLPWERARVRASGQG